MGGEERASRTALGAWPGPTANAPADDIAESVHWATSQPAHVNINTIELMPVAQSFAAFQVQRA